MAISVFVMMFTILGVPALFVLASYEICRMYDIRGGGSSYKRQLVMNDRYQPLIDFVDGKQVTEFEVARAVRNFSSWCQSQGFGKSQVRHKADVLAVKLWQRFNRSLDLLNEFKEQIHVHSGEEGYAEECLIVAINELDREIRMLNPNAFAPDAAEQPFYAVASMA